MRAILSVYPVDENRPAYSARSLFYARTVPNLSTWTPLILPIVFGRDLTILYPPYSSGGVYPYLTICTPSLTRVPCFWIISWFYRWALYSNLVELASFSAGWFSMGRPTRSSGQRCSSQRSNVSYMEHGNNSSAGGLLFLVVGKNVFYSSDGTGLTVPKVVGSTRLGDFA